MTCAYISLNQPILTNNIMTSVHHFLWHKAKIHYDVPMFHLSNQIPPNFISHQSELFHLTLLSYRILPDGYLSQDVITLLTGFAAFLIIYFE